MKLIGIMPCRNEEWVIGLSARVALLWLDELIILDHASTDATHSIIMEIAREHPDRVEAMLDRDLKWDEMRHRQRMLEVARQRGATHIAIVDADEVLTGNLSGEVSPSGRGAWVIRDLIASMPAGHILTLPGYNLRGSLNLYHASGVWGTRWFSTAFVDDERLYWGGDNFHHREPMIKYGGNLKQYMPIAQGQGGVLHLWGCSDLRLKAKHALYKVTERLRWPAKPVHQIDDLYNLAIHGNGRRDTPAWWDFTPVHAAWWDPYRHLMQYLDVDAEPWQDSEVRRLIAEHGRETFVGLDLFDVA